MVTGTLLTGSNIAAECLLFLSDGSVEAVQAAVPDWLAIGFSLATNLGDPWLAIPILTLTYWYGVRERALPLFAAVLGGMSFVLLAKAVLGLPRPPVGPPVPPETVPELLRPLYHYTVEQDGYGVPSGHAAIGTLVWGTVALSLPGECSTRRLLGAATVAVVVALSRVVLGVHYPIDVVAGVAVGIVVLAVALALDERVDNAALVLFAAGVLIAAAAVLVHGPTTETLSLFGGLLGGLVGLVLFDHPPTSFDRSLRGIAVGTGGLVAVIAVSGGIAVLALQVASVAGGGPVDAVLSILSGLLPTIALGIGILGWPVVVERAELA